MPIAGEVIHSSSPDRITLDDVNNQAGECLRAFLFGFLQHRPSFLSLDASAALREQQELGYLDMKRNKGLILYPELCFGGKAQPALPGALQHMPSSLCAQGGCSSPQTAHVGSAWHPSDPLAPL